MEMSTQPGLSTAESGLLARSQGQTAAPAVTMPIGSQGNVMKPPPFDPATADQQVIKVAQAIRNVETQGNFNAIGDNGSSMGAYQWNNGNKPVEQGQTPINWQNAAEQYLGSASAPMTPENQNFVAYSQIKAYKDQGLTPISIDALWNGAKPDPVNPGQYIHNNSERATAFNAALTNIVNGMPQNNPTEPNTGLPTYGATFAGSPQDNPFVFGLKTLGNIPSSTWGVLSGIGSILNPMNLPKNLENIGRTEAGVVENVTGMNGPGTAPDLNQQTANAIGDFFVKRYGSLAAVKNSIENDPAGVVTDIAAALAGGEGLAAKGADIADAVAGTGKAAEAANRTASFADTGINTMPTSGAMGTAIRGANQAINGAISGFLAPAMKVPSAVFGKASGILFAADPEAITAAQRAGVTLSAAAMSSSSLLHRIEAWAVIGAGGEGDSKIITTALEQMAKAGDKIIESTGGAKDFSTAIQKVGDGMTNMEDAMKNADRANYQYVENQGWNGRAAQATAPIKLLNEIISSKAAIADTENLKFFKDKLAVLTGGKLGAVKFKNPTFDTIKNMKTNLGEIISPKNWADPFRSKNAAMLTRFYGSLIQAERDTLFAAGGKNAVELYDSTKQAHAVMMDEIGAAFAAKVHKLVDEGQYSNILDALIKPSTAAEDIPKMLKMMGTEGTQNLRSAFVQRLLMDSKNADGEFTAKGILSQMKKYQDERGDRLSMILEPAQVQGLQDLGKVSEAIAKVNRITQGSQTAYLMRAGLEYGAVGKALVWDLPTGNFAGAAKTLGLVFGGEGLAFIYTTKPFQDLMKFFIRHTEEYKKVGQELGLTIDRSGGNMGGNGNTETTNRTPPSGIPSDMPGGSSMGLPRNSGGDTGGSASATSNSSLPTVAETALNKLKTEGGFSLSTHGQDVPTEGFMYSPDKATETPIPQSEMTLAKLNQFQSKYEPLLSKKDVFFGAYPDENGNWVLDASTHTYNPKEAVANALQADQKAVYSLHEGYSYYREPAAGQKSYADLAAQETIVPRQSAQGGRVAENMAGNNSGSNGANGGQRNAAPQLARSPAEIKKASNDYYEANKDSLLKDYLAKNGNVANSDTARPFFKEQGYNGTNPMDVHVASKKLSTAAWLYGLARKGANDIAVVLGGGSGSGKSSVISAVEDKMIKNASAVWDGNSDSLASAEKRIGEAIDAGKVVQFRYVYRPIGDAFDGMIARMLGNVKEEGRLVPISEIVDNHIGSLEVAKHLLKFPKISKWVDEGKLDVKYFENLGNREEASQISLAKLEKIVYNKTTAVKALKATAKKLYEKGTINKQQYAAITK